jgi:hypothetical protein
MPKERIDEVCQSNWRYIMGKFYRGIRVQEKNQENDKVVKGGIYRGVKHSGTSKDFKMKSGSYRGVKWNETSSTENNNNEKENGSIS